MSEVKSREPLFSKKNKKLITDPLNDNNPVTIQVLGICSALAITVSIAQALTMTAAVIFVLVLGNVIVSLLRNLIPSRIRIIVQLVVVASLVIIVNEILKAFFTRFRREIISFRRINYYQLYYHGTFRSICYGEQTMGFCIRWFW